MATDLLSTGFWGQAALAWAVLRRGLCYPAVFSTKALLGVPVSHFFGGVLPCSLLGADQAHIHFTVSFGTADDGPQTPQTFHVPHGVHATGVS